MNRNVLEIQSSFITFYLSVPTDAGSSTTDGPLGQLIKATTATVLEMVSENITPPNKLTPNGSVQSGGTPTSSCSHVTTETMDISAAILSERNRSRSVPDLVEHTENAQVVIRDDKKLLPGSQKGHKLKRSSKSPYAFRRSYSVPDLVEHTENIQVIIRDNKKRKSGKLTQLFFIVIFEDEEWCKPRNLESTIGQQGSPDTSSHI